MAQQAAKLPARQRKRSVARSPTRRARTGRARPRHSQDATVRQLERVIRNLERRVAELTSAQGIRSTVSSATSQVGNAVTQASHQVGEAVADTLTEVAGKLRSGVTSVAGAARLGTGAMERIGTELERRPFMTVAIALGIGFLAGLAGRRE